MQPPSGHPVPTAAAGRGGPTDVAHDEQLRRGIIHTQISRGTAWALVGLFLLFIAAVPLVQIVVGLWLLFGPGDEGANEYGPAPAKNTTGVLILAWSLPVLIVLGGILAAISIPAYKDYTDRARAAQMQDSQ